MITIILSDGKCIIMYIDSIAAVSTSETEIRMYSKILNMIIG